MYGGGKLAGQTREEWVTVGKLNQDHSSRIGWADYLLGACIEVHAEVWDSQVGSVPLDMHMCGGKSST